MTHLDIASGTPIANRKEASFPPQRTGIFLAKELTAMNESSLQSWWILALRGAIAFLFGVLALLWPDLTLLGLVALSAAYALLYGPVSLVGAMRDKTHDEGGW